MTDVGEGAVERDPVADVNVEAVLPVGLVDLVGVCQRERLPLFTVACIKHKHAHDRSASIPNRNPNEC